MSIAALTVNVAFSIVGDSAGSGRLQRLARLLQLFLDVGYGHLSPLILAREFAELRLNPG